MKWQILFSGENKNNITNVSSAEFVQRMVTLKMPCKTEATTLSFFSSPESTADVVLQCRLGPLFVVCRALSTLSDLSMGNLDQIWVWALTACFGADWIKIGFPSNSKLP